MIFSSLIGKKGITHTPFCYICECCVMCAMEQSCIHYDGCIISPVIVVVHIVRMDGMEGIEQVKSDSVCDDNGAKTALVDDARPSSGDVGAAEPANGDRVVTSDYCRDEDEKEKKSHRKHDRKVYTCN